MLEINAFYTRDEHFSAGNQHVENALQSSVTQRHSYCSYHAAISKQNLKWALSHRGDPKGIWMHNGVFDCTKVVFEAK